MSSSQGKKTSYTLYDSNDIGTISPNLHPDFLKTKSPRDLKSPRYKALTGDVYQYDRNYTYIPLDVDTHFSPANLEQDFFWVSRLKSNLVKDTLTIQKILSSYTEKLVYISKLNNLWEKYNKIQDNLAIRFGKVDTYIRNPSTKLSNKKIQIAITLGLIIPYLRNKNQRQISRLTQARSNLFYYYYFIKNTFLPEVKSTQRLLSDYQTQ